MKTVSDNLSFQASYQPVPFPTRLNELVVGKTLVMQRLKHAIAQIGPSSVSTVIVGPTGSGKEVVAQALHAVSERPGPLVALNCGAIPADLIEAELFGHEKGAFTGAQGQRIGMLEQADGGTLFLDEIGDMPTHVQVKLLRALETKTIQRVGGVEPITVDFRLLSATHRDLQAEVEANRFREDLLFRIQVFTLSVPPLSARTEDIPLILQEMSARSGVPALQLCDEALSALAAHPWAGNVRELRNFHDRAQVLYPSKGMGPHDVRAALSPRYGAPMPKEAAVSVSSTQIADVKTMLQKSKSVDMRSMMQKMESHIITSALELSGGSTTVAAEMLTLKRTTLIGRIQKLGISHEPAKAVQQISTTPA